jgi:signal transduction histidine kinase
MADHTVSKTATDPLDVLLVEDNRQFTFLLKEHLHLSRPDMFRVHAVTRLADGIESVQTAPPDLVLLDLGLPDSQGIETFLKMHAVAEGIPVVVLSGMDDEQLAIEAVREGAQDYLAKGRLERELLVRAMLHAIERQKARERLAHAARLLAASERRFQGLLDDSAEGIVILDKDFCCEFINRAATSMLGQSRRDLTGERLDFLVAEDGNDEIDIVRPGNTPRRAEVRAAETRWDGAWALMLTIRDVTDRHRIDELRSKLEEEELFSQQLKALDVSRSEFVQTVTRELRAPLAPMKRALDMLIDGALGDLSDSQREILDLVDRNLERLARFATAALELSRLESGADLRLEMVDLSTALETTLEPLQWKARNREIDLKWDGPAGLKVFANDDAVSEVVAILVDNALWTNPAGTNIEVSARPRGPSYVEVIVSDDGTGIPDGALAMLMQSTLPTDTGGDRDAGDASFGVQLCRTLIERMGGMFYTQSRPQEGTSHRFTLATGPRTPSTLFGRVARDLGFLTDEQVSDVYRDHDSQQRGRKRIGQLLVDQGLLTSEQRDEVLRVLSRRLSGRHPRMPRTTLRDGMMGRIALNKGYVSERQLNEGLRIQEQTRTQGAHRTLGQVLLERGFLTDEELDDVLREQGIRPDAR